MNKVFTGIVMLLLLGGVAAVGFWVYTNYFAAGAVDRIPEYRTGMTVEEFSRNAEEKGKCRRATITKSNSSGGEMGLGRYDSKNEFPVAAIPTEGFCTYYTEYDRLTVYFKDGILVDSFHVAS